MAGFQPASNDVRAEGIVKWMERRRREVAARGPDAELAGRAEWETGIVAGELPFAPRPADVVTLGVRATQRGRGEERSSPVAAASPTSASTSNWTPMRWTTAQPQAQPMAYRSASTAGVAAPATTRPSHEDEMAKLRCKQAVFKDVVREESRRNSWMAIPALAPVAAVLLAEGAGLLASRVAVSQLNRAPLNLLGRELGLAPKPAPVPKPSTSPLTTGQKSGIRDAARARFGRANPAYNRRWEVDIHHRVDLRFAHLFPKADPNRLANLEALQKGARNIATQATNAFVRSLRGREPTQAEVMEHVLKVDKLIETYLVRGGVPRPPPKAPK